VFSLVTLAYLNLALAFAASEVLEWRGLGTKEEAKRQSRQEEGKRREEVPDPPGRRAPASCNADFSVCPRYETLGAFLCHENQLSELAFPISATD
jgi:hypothetical protein